MRILSKFTKGPAKDDVEEFPGKSFYKYSEMDLGPSCNECFECVDCRKKRKERMKNKLGGEVYFSSPLDFNDIIDSQLEVENNVNSLDEKKLYLKLKELFYDADDNIEDISQELKKSNYSEVVQKVYKKQLEKIGILCFTVKNTNAAMWGYYSNNRGICIEYDTENLMYDITTNFAAQMSESLTRFLLEEKEYSKKDRDKGSKPNRTKYAKKIFKNEEEIVASLKENQVLTVLPAMQQKHFVQNLYVKRLWGRKVSYYKNYDIQRVKPSLFEKKDEKNVSGKYFVKDEFWKHEQEYRFILSLGGKKAIQLREGTVKSITFGANISNESIEKIKENINSKVNLYKIIVINNQLKAIPI
ncbi:hypothetical protein CG419_01340 [Latilactobacillus curvatus]|uniref:DUF2971 domain-containing protein n=1 Tax=Latilactobacillus curvatus TaxID=28038 RepID=A0AAC9UPV9_LATCU|nr:DUF2971 domain-containing protein [Latilactobacillus curvatus]ASN59349.1 hypothetical protein CG419_01340 [Latilactobacillus curvatus]